MCNFSSTRRKIKIKAKKDPEVTISIILSNLYLSFGRKQRSINTLFHGVNMRFSK